MYTNNFRTASSRRRDAIKFKKKPVVPAWTAKTQIQWIVAHGRAAIYKLAHDEKFDSHSIGSVLTAHMMQHAIDLDKVFEVDYLMGDDNYKKDWMSHRRERWGIVAYNPQTILGLFGSIKQAIGEMSRNISSRMKNIRSKLTYV